MKKLSIRTNILLLVLASVIGLSIPYLVALKSQMLSDKKEKTRNLVESAHSTISYYYKLAKDGNLSEEQAKSEALSAIKAMRYDSKEYFWINDTALPYPKMIMHSANPKLDGKVLDAAKFNCATKIQAGNDGDLVGTDGNKNLFQCFAEVSKEKGSGFVIYNWTKPKEGGGVTEDVYPKLSYVKKIDGWNWIVGSGIYIDDMNSEFMHTIYKNLIIIIPIILLLIFVSWLIISTILNSIRDVVEPITALSSSMSRGDANLRTHIETEYENELKEITTAVNTYIEATRTIVEYAKITSSENASVSTELAQTSTNIGHRVEEDVRTINTILANVEDISSHLNDSAERTKESRNDVMNANDALEKARNELSLMVGNIQGAVMTEMEFASRLQDLTHEADRVKGVLSVIGDIADQTNLLALNAAIEAARAGEHGRGFAVVADEVRKLAERTQKSLLETNATINTIVQSINEAAEQMSSNAESIKMLGDSSKNIEMCITDSVEIMQKTTGSINHLSGNNSENAKEINDISKMLSSISGAAQINARSVEEIASSTQHLNDMTDNLNQKLKQFRT